MDVTYGDNFDSDPCLHVRMPPASDGTNELIGYVFLAFRDFAAIDREDAANEGAELASQKLSQELEIGRPIALIFRVTGTDPVKLEATLLKPRRNTGIDPHRERRLIEEDHGRGQGRLRLRPCRRDALRQLHTLRFPAARAERASPATPW